MKSYVALACLASLVLASARLIASPAQADAPTLTPAQSDYVQYCGGCHGFQGDSSPAPVPVLLDRVGYFMCNQSGREYMLRLPNVVNTPIDDEAVAEMMNFMVFGLGGRSILPTARPFTVEDVAGARRRILVGDEVETMRRSVVEAAIKQCGAPVSLRQAYPGEVR